VRIKWQFTLRILGERDMNKRLGVEIAVLLLLASTILVVAPLAEASDSWSTMAPLPTALSGCKAAAVNGIIYVFSTSVTYAYNPATNSWSNKTPMPTPRSTFAVTAFGGKIYVIGGKLNPSSPDIVMTGKNEAYNPATDTWETKTSMPVPNELCEANAAGGSIYIIGGLKDPIQGDASNINQAYNPASDSWSLKASMPTAVFKYASAVVDGKIYVMGGEGRNTPGNLTQIYNPQSDSWAAGPSLPGPSNGAGAAATTGVKAPKRIYVIGGRQGYTYDVSAVNHVLDPVEGTWASGASMRIARQGLAVAVVDDQIYAIGGSYPEIQQGTGSQALGKQTITLVSKVTPVNFMPYSSTAANERYTPIGYSETQPAISPSSTATVAPSPTYSPTQTPTASPSYPANTPPFTPSPQATTTNPQQTNPPISTPTPPSQQTPTANQPESGSPFEALTPGWLTLIAVLAVGLPLSVLLVRRASRKGKVSLP
jgi:N-acetylneuraminic acid mutarotase